MHIGRHSNVDPKIKFGASQVEAAMNTDAPPPPRLIIDNFNKNNPNAATAGGAAKFCLASKVEKSRWNNC